MVLKGEKAPETAIVFVFGDSDGKQRATSLSLDVDDLFELMRANSDRCSAVKEPDFYNGCIGPGDIEMATPDSN